MAKRKEVVLPGQPTTQQSPYIPIVEFEITEHTHGIDEAVQTLHDFAIGQEVD